MNCDPIIEVHEGIHVLRDDLYPGGTKARILPRLMKPGLEYVYAGPVYGYAQVALGHAATEVGAMATAFVAERKEPHPRTLEAKDAGTRIIQVPNGYLSNVRAKARAYCELTGATLLPFGLDTPLFVSCLADFARGLNFWPTEAWCVAGSGTLARALQLAWPHTPVHAIRVGHDPDVGGASLQVAPEPFERDAMEPPPFPSCSNYDAKAWRFVREQAKPGALFWNVAK